MDYIQAQDFTALKSPILPKLNQYGKQCLEYYISLDTECSWNHDEDDPKAWIYSFAFKYGEQLVFGRKPSELIKCLESISIVNKMHAKKLKAIIYVHNLSYDISYLKDFLDEAFGVGQMLAVSPHKYISYEVGDFILKCSYRLSGKSLHKWSKDLGATYIKDSSDIDYSRIYYQDTTLPERYIEYQLNDVLTLDACIKVQLDMYMDTLQTIPLTATGYVRRDIKRRFRAEDETNEAANNGRKTNRRKFLKMQLDLPLYKASRRAFHGGYTHKNRYLLDNIARPSDIEDCDYIAHGDFRSHYPSGEMCSNFPDTPWTMYSNESNIDTTTIDELLSLNKEGNCILVHLLISDIKLRKGVSMPMLQSVKVREGARTRLNLLDDNGRVLQCRGMFDIWCTEYELIEIVEQYEPFNYEVMESYIAKSAPLPTYMRDTILQYFQDKTDFKDIEEELKHRGQMGEDVFDEQLEAHLNLMKSKAGLNSIYGCSATNPVREEYTIDDEEEWHPIINNSDIEIEKRLKKYYKSRNNIMTYQYGIYTTAIAQFQLYQYIKAIGYDKVLYCDTDSIFYYHTPETQKAIDDLNEINRHIAMERGAYITSKRGKLVHFNHFSDEGEKIVEFKSLHSKCYAYNEEGFETNKNLRHAVIAGVTATSRNYLTDGITRIDELGDIDELSNNKKFSLCGGTRSIYLPGAAGVEMIEGHPTETAGACIIMDNEKTLSYMDIDEDDDLVFEFYETE